MLTPGTSVYHWSNSAAVCTVLWPSPANTGFLGANKKPVFAGDGHKTVHTAAEFDQWYTDVPGVNITTEFQIPFSTAANGHLVYDNQNFFPLDGQGWGNEGNNH